MSSLSRMLAGFFGAIALWAQPAAQLPANHPISIWRDSLRAAGWGSPAGNAYTLRDIGPDRSEASRALLELLKDSSPEVQGYAATALGQFRLAPEVSVPALIQLLSDPDDFVRQHAALAVAAFGKDAVPDLVKALDWEPGYDKAPRKTRTLATYGAVALVEIGPPAVDALLAKPGDVEKNLYAIFVLKSHPRYAVLRLREQLQSTDEKTRIAAMGVLGSMAANAERWDMPAPFELNLNPRDSREVLPLLLDRLTSPSLNERRAAARTLNDLGSMDSEMRQRVLPLLLRALDDPDPKVEISVLSAIESFGSLDEDAVARVAKLYRNPEVRLAALLALGSIGRNSRLAAEIIAKAAKDPDTFVRRYAVDAVSKLGPSGMPLLIELLQDKDDYVRGTAVESLGTLGPNAAASVPALIPLLGHSGSVIDTLRKIGPASVAAIPGLLAVLERNERETGDVVLALANMGPPGIEAIQRIWERAGEGYRHIILGAVTRGGKNAAITQWLISLYSSHAGDEGDIMRALASRGPAALEFFTKGLKDPGSGIRVAAAEALSDTANNNADDSGAAALSTVLTVADDPEPGLRRAAASLLPSAGPSALPVLRKALSDPDKTVRWTAADSLRYAAVSLGTGLDDATLHALAETLKGDNHDIRIPVLEALGHAGSRSAFAVSAIVPLLHDKDEDVPRAAADALAAIGSFPPEAAGAVNLQIMDSYITKHVQALVGDIENDAGPIGPDRRRKKGPPAVAEATGVVENVQKLPALPWPMPQPSAWAALDKTLLGRDATALKDVEEKLAKALVATGFSEPGILSAPSGFAMLSQVERIHDDGTPYNPPDRWSSGKLALRSFSLKDYLSSLFFDTPGEFRLFVFIITTELNPVKSDATLPEEAARQLAAKGGRILPDDIGNLTLKGRNCFVLVYQFQREQGQFTTLSQNGISAREHMQKAGIARGIQ